MYFDLKNVAIMITSIVHSKLNYCNSLAYNITIFLTLNKTHFNKSRTVYNG